MLSENKNKKPLAWKKSTKINFNAKCSCTLNLPTLTPNVHPTKQLLYFLWLKWFSLWGPHQQGGDLPISSILLSSKCSITSKGGFKWPLLGDSLFLPKIKRWSSGIWRETNCDPMAGVAGVLDPLTVPWILTSLCSILFLHCWRLSCNWFSLAIQEDELPPALGGVVLETSPCFTVFFAATSYFTPKHFSIHIPWLEGVGTSKTPACHSWTKWICQNNLCGQ